MVDGAGVCCFSVPLADTTRIVCCAVCCGVVCCSCCVLRCCLLLLLSAVRCAACCNVWSQSLGNQHYTLLLPMATLELQLCFWIKIRFVPTLWMTTVLAALLIPHSCCCTVGSAACNNHPLLRSLSHLQSADCSADCVVVRLHSHATGAGCRTPRSR